MKLPGLRLKGGVALNARFTASPAITLVEGRLYRLRVNLRRKSAPVRLCRCPGMTSMSLPANMVSLRLMAPSRLCRRAQNRHRLNAPSRIPGGDHGSARVRLGYASPIWPSPLSDGALAARFMANTLRPPPSVKTKVVNRGVPGLISGQIHPFNGSFVAKGEALAPLSERR